MNGKQTHTKSTPHNGQKSPEQIEQEINHTREEMSHTLDALGHKLSPGELVDQAMDYLRGPNEFVTNLSESVKRNPLPVALVGIGLGWLMMSGRSGSVPQSGISTSALGEKMGRASENISGTAQHMREQASHVRESMRRQGHRAQSALQTMWADQPLVLGALGIALGAVLGSGVPISRQESEMMGRQRDAVSSRVAEAGKGQVRKAGEKAVHKTAGGAKTTAKKPSD